MGHGSSGEAPALAGVNCAILAHRALGGGSLLSECGRNDGDGFLCHGWSIGAIPDPVGHTSGQFTVYCVVRVDRDARRAVVVHVVLHCNPCRLGLPSPVSGQMEPYRTIHRRCGIRRLLFRAAVYVPVAMLLGTEAAGRFPCLSDRSRDLCSKDDESRLSSPKVRIKGDHVEGVRLFETPDQFFMGNCR
jgi:hypothetical protein